MIWKIRKNIERAKVLEYLTIEKSIKNFSYNQALTESIYFLLLLEIQNIMLKIN